MYSPGNIFKTLLLLIEFMIINERYLGDRSYIIMKHHNQYAFHVAPNPEALNAMLERAEDRKKSDHVVLARFDGINDAGGYKISFAVGQLKKGRKIKLEKLLE